MSEPYDIVVFDKYEKDGEKKSRSYVVGVAFENQNGTGFNCMPLSDIAITGPFSILPRRKKEPEQPKG